MIFYPTVVDTDHVRQALRVILVHGGSGLLYWLLRLVTESLRDSGPPNPHKCGKLSLRHPLRFSFTGELAFELHAAQQDLGRLWGCLWEAGQAQGIAAFGSKALNALRLEKGYRGWHELSDDVSPLEVEQMRFVKSDRDFLGRAALLSHRGGSRIALIALKDTETDCLGGEAVFHGESVVVSISSAAYGYWVGRSLAFAFLRPDVLPDAELEISLFGRRVAAEILPKPPHDPENLRLRCEEKLA